jgi:hypothetical protein
MIAYAINEDLVVQEIPQKKPYKRRALVTALLALAALGTHYLPARPLHTLTPELAVAQPITQDNAAQTVQGPNNLFGDAGIDHHFDAPVATTLGPTEQDFSTILDQAGSEPTAAATTLEGFTSADFKQVAVSAGTSPVTPDASFAAVPEPTTAGLLLLVAAPVIGLRRKRS